MASSSPQPTSTEPLKDEEDEITKLKTAIQREKAAKRKMYGYLVKIADELKTLRNESEQLINAAEYARRAWYEGGMWRGVSSMCLCILHVSFLHNLYLIILGQPNVLPGAYARSGSEEHGNNEGNGGMAIPGFGVPQAPVSLSDLFLDLVTVTAFTRVGSAIQERGLVDAPILAYFAVFWQIWSKEASYSTRFDTSDISSHLETLLACFALLAGSLSAFSDFHSAGSDRIMAVAAFVALLHMLLHARVWFWFKEGGQVNSVNWSVKRYAVFTTIMNILEATTWFVGMSLPLESEWRGWVFLVGILLNMRLPRGFMPNDFHAACSKRGVLFILLLGFNLQSILVVASPYFQYWDPTIDQYTFVFLACFLMFMIKLLYVDDTYSIAPQDHALLYNRLAGFFFHIGNFSLLFFTTVLGSGLNLLTQSFLAAAAALPSEAKNLVCGGFSATILSITFIKSMHIRRVPTDPKHQNMFYTAYFAQFVVVIATVYVSARMYLTEDTESGLAALLMRNEIEMLSVLVGFSVVVVFMSWLDEAIELRLYSDAAEAEQCKCLCRLKLDSSMNTDNILTS
jgi:hypothetical protein